MQYSLTLRIRCWGLKKWETFALKICIFSFSWKKWKSCQWQLHTPTRHHWSRGTTSPPTGRASSWCVSLVPTTSQYFTAIHLWFCISLFIFLLGVYKHLSLGPQLYRFKLFTLTCSFWFICDHSNINLHVCVCVCLVTQACPTLCDPIDCT